LKGGDVTEQQKGKSGDGRCTVGGVGKQVRHCLGVNEVRQAWLAAHVGRHGKNWEQRMWSGRGMHDAGHCRATVDVL
jgi:hypothetical protein